MADKLPIGRSVARKATAAVSYLWWCQARKIAEKVSDPAARWDLLVQALATVGKVGQRDGK